MTEPVVKKIRGSYFPDIDKRMSYEVSTVAGDVIYVGMSYFVARLVKACLTPRT